MLLLFSGVGEPFVGVNAKAQEVAPQAAAGDLDPAFGSGGKVATDFFGRVDAAPAMAVQSDGKIVLAGYSTNPTGTRLFGLARYNTGGSLDQTFGANGKVTTDFFHTNAAVNGIALQGDGRIIAAGYASQPVAKAGRNGVFALARYTTDGSLDLSFGNNGLVTTSVLGNDDLAYAVAVGPDGKIVAAGLTVNQAALPNFAVVRYNQDGRLDTTFGNNGKVVNSVADAADFATSALVQPDNKILIAGQTMLSLAGVARFVVLRYNANGSYDTGFGTNGSVISDFSQQLNFAAAIALQSDGKIVAAGTAQLGAAFFNSEDFALARYNANGTPDGSFNGGAAFGEQTDSQTANDSIAARLPGTVTTDFFGFEDRANALAIQSDGKIVVAGTSHPSSNFEDYRFSVARYRPNGELDRTFGTNGKTTTDFFGNSAGAGSVALQSDGKIVVAGATATGNPDNYDFALARLIGDVADFSLGVNQSSIVAQRGAKVPVDIAINRVGGFTGNVTITPPDASQIGVKVKPPDPQSTTDSTIRVKLKVKDSATPGSHQLVFAGTDDSGRTRSVALTLVVQ